MISYFQAIVLGLLQGFAELFPISSLGHSVLLPAVLKWPLDRSSDEFVAFLVLTHLATSLVLLAFFWRDWAYIVGGILRSLRLREISVDDTYARLGWLLVVSTVPAGILGLLFEEKLQRNFAAAGLIAVMLTFNGLVLLLVEVLRKPSEEGVHDDHKLAALSWRQAIGIGLAQCLALIPGFSRTGVTMAGGLVNGLSHENAVRYSFLLATPIIFAAAVLKVPDLFTNGAGSGVNQALVGALCAALTAYLSIRFLLRYFETKTLTPFAIYCALAGLIALAIVSV